MNVKQRWQDNQPLARVAFFGINGPVEVSVFDMASTGIGMLSMAINWCGHLKRVVVLVSHLVYVVDKTPRQASGPLVDCRLFMANGKALDTVMSSMRRSSTVPGLWSCMCDDGGRRVRALVSDHAMVEIVPLRDDDEEVILLSVPSVVNDELWPELGRSA